MDRRLLMFGVFVLLFSAGVAEAQAGSIMIEATSKGVKVEGADFQATAQRVFYDEAKGRLILEGREDFPASLFRQRKHMEGEDIRGMRIIYSFKEGKLWVQN